MTVPTLNAVTGKNIYLSIFASANESLGFHSLGSNEI